MRVGTLLLDGPRLQHARAALAAAAVASRDGACLLGSRVLQMRRAMNYCRRSGWALLGAGLVLAASSCDGSDDVSQIVARNAPEATAAAPSRLRAGPDFRVRRSV